MTEAVTLNQARLRLGVGREKLKRLLAQMDIEPAQINRQRKEISVEQFDQLRQLLDDDPETSGLNTGQPAKPAIQDYQSSSQLNRIDLEPILELALLKEKLEAAQKEVSQLASQLQSTETKLETQLQKAEEERLAERQEWESHQMLMMKFQQDNQHLRQQLLESLSASTFSVSNPVAEPEIPVEFTEFTLRPEMIASAESSARAFGIIALVALAALAWVTITNPELPLRETIASLWQ
jgi:hypothetical protein